MFRALSLACLLAGPALVADEGIDPEPKKPAEAVLKALQGEWEIVKAVKDGVDGTKEMPRGAFVLIKKDQMIFKAEKEPEDPATIKIDPRQKPAHIDISADRGKEQMKGVFKLEKDTLTISFNDNGQDRPKGFDKAHGQIVLRRRAAKK